VEVTDHEQLPFDVEDVGAVEDDPVVQLPSGQFKLRSELSDEELAGGFRVRRDLVAPRPRPF
jgi:hypothetical protein